MGMGVEPGPVRCFIGGERRRHAVHAAALAHEVDRQLTARAELLGGDANVPVELPCKLFFAHVLRTTVLRPGIDAQRAARLDSAAPRGRKRGRWLLSHEPPSPKGLADPASMEMPRAASSCFSER